MARAEGGVMRPRELREIAAAMARAGVARLELEGPGQRLVLARGEAATAPGAGDGPPAASPARPVLAPCAGHFLRCHPLHEAPLAANGAAVAAGQPVALMRSGLLLVPVPAPEAGIVGPGAVAEGALAGHGDHLLDIWPPATEDPGADRP